MPGARALQSAGLLILLASGTAAFAARASFLRPLDGDIVAGPTQFEFEVSPGEPAIQRIDVYIEGLLIGSAVAPDWGFVWTPVRPLRDKQIVAAVFAGGKLLGRVSIHTSDMNFGDVVDVIEVQLFPVVQDRRGRYVPNLTVDDFEIYEEGRQIGIETFSSEPAALTLAVLIDVSRSMEPKLQLVQKASVGFLDALDSSDVVSIYAFNHGARRVLDPTGDLELAKERVRGLRAEGGTALYDAVVRALTDLEVIPGRRVLVVFSDGRDERSLTTLNRVVEAAHRSEAVVYTIGAGESEKDLAARDDLGALATATGGEAHVIDKLKALPELFSAILTDVRAQYHLTFTPPPGATGVREIEVRAKEKKYRVRCRTTYAVKGEAQ